MTHPHDRATAPPLPTLAARFARGEIGLDEFRAEFYGALPEYERAGDTGPSDRILSLLSDWDDGELGLGELRRLVASVVTEMGSTGRVAPLEPLSIG